MSFVKGTFTKEIDKAVDEVIGKEILRFTCQFFIKGGKYGFQPFGSGVCLKISNNYFIATASHVLEGQEPLYVKGDGKFVLIIGDVRESDIEKSGGLDLAYIKLDPFIIPFLNFSHDFLGIEKIVGKHKLLDGSQYGVLGFPERNIKIIEGKVSTGGAYYMLPPMEKRIYEYYKLDENIFILLKFSGKGINMREQGKINKISDPYGISGCGIWFMMPKIQENTIEIDYKLIGLAIGGKKKFHSIVGNRIEILLSAMNYFGDINLKEKK